MAEARQSRYGAGQQALRADPRFLERQHELGEATRRSGARARSPVEERQQAGDESSLHGPLHGLTPMALTRSWEGTLAGKLEVLEQAKPVERKRELLWLAIASALICTGLLSVFLARTQDFAHAASALTREELVDLNRATSAEQVAAGLQAIPPELRQET